MRMLGRRTSAERPEAKAVLGRMLEQPRYEVVPMSGTRERLERLPAGARVAVTCSPSRGLEPTIKLAEQLAEAGLDVSPHLAARATTGEVELKDVLSRLEVAGVRDVFVVGGDSREPAGPYTSGAEMLQAMRDVGHTFPDVGVPGYPEGHGLLEEETLYGALREKLDSATYMVTQMCFDGAAMARWLERLRSRGIDLPVSFGVPGVVDPRKLARISAKIGVGESSRYARRNAKAVWRLLRPGGYKADKLLRDLATRVADDTGIIGAHLYTFNQVEATYDWARSLYERATAQTADERSM